MDGFYWAVEILHKYGIMKCEAFDCSGTIINSILSFSSVPNNTGLVLRAGKAEIAEYYEQVEIKTE